MLIRNRKCHAIQVLYPRRSKSHIREKVLANQELSLPTPWLGRSELKLILEETESDTAKEGLNEEEEPDIPNPWERPLERSTLGFVREKTESDAASSTHLTGPEDSNVKAQPDRQENTTSQSDQSSHSPALSSEETSPLLPHNEEGIGMTSADEFVLNFDDQHCLDLNFPTIANGEVLRKPKRRNN